MSMSFFVFVLWFLRALAGGEIAPAAPSPTYHTSIEMSAESNGGEFQPTSGICVDPNGKPTRCPWDPVAGGQ